MVLNSIFTLQPSKEILTPDSTQPTKSKIWDGGKASVLFDSFIYLIPMCSWSWKVLLYIENVQGPAGGIVVNFAHHFGSLEFTGSDPGCRLTHCSSSHAVVASHIQNRGRLAHVLAQQQSSSSKKRKIGTDFSSKPIFLSKRRVIFIRCHSVIV